MMMCTRCHKRVAVIFISSTKDGKETQEGLCVKCAKELGIKPIDDLLAKTGMDDETIERFNSEMETMLENFSCRGGKHPRATAPIVADEKGFRKRKIQKNGVFSKKNVKIAKIVSHGT